MIIEKRGLWIRVVGFVIMVPPLFLYVFNPLKWYLLGVFMGMGVMMIGEGIGKLIQIK